MPTTSLTTPFTLPCGAVVPNRLVKAAMTERISNGSLEPTENHHTLYKKWSETGAGILITGNVIIDKTHLESSGNIFMGDENMLPKLKAWAESGKMGDNHVWVQISHAGRQTNKFSTSRPLAPSNVQLHKMFLFGKPKAMEESDIQAVIAGFKKAAQLSKEAGFTGIQIHSAHGYLLSQFLSPRTNTRTDQWGGSLENRSRLLLSIIKECREAVGPDFPISVKLNSSDFQKGGFTEEESLEVVKMLDKEGIDLLEISGGTYERLAFFELNEEQPDMKESTRRREAYFIEFSQKIRAVSKLPLLITGGFRSWDFCNETLASGELDFVGMARPFITNVDEIADFLDGKIPSLDNLVKRTGIKAFEDAAEGGFYAKQLINLSCGKKVTPNMNPLWASNFLILHEMKEAFRNRFS